MRILIMAQCYAPEEVSAAVMITELATDLAKHGHQVSVITGAPNYPYGRVFKGYRNQFYQAETLDGVRVIRTWSYISPSKKFWPRLLHYGTYSATAFYGGLAAGRPDVLISFSPPLPLGISAWLLSRAWQIPWVLQLEDLYPDAAVAAGVMTNKKVISFFRGLEKFLYQKSHQISVISESFRQTLLAKKVPNSKIEVIPVWADPAEVRPLPKQNTFRLKQGLDDKFVVMYAGNLGLTSCLEDILQAAEVLREQTSIQFVIVGEGAKKETLEAGIRSKQLTNVMILPYQPRDIFPEMLAAADVILVTLNAAAALSSLPSKIFSGMASARPILAVAPLGSELAHIVREANCGWTVPPGSSMELATSIASAMNQGSVLVQMGQNGRAYLERYYSRNHCVAAYEKMLIALCKAVQKKHVDVGEVL
ncbi:MAG TPA: glycosyltransferase family 4 protein [Anaerolineales bacterium]|nr:glycosyltransferase family 4 protein [Anaerolineales bacterium]HLO28425.1 glycosyltransferase family 4 protein [Anaerolineales bacterium]